ncbi:MAG: 5'-methylthioadenosine/S-adenosylhomocysteine nucleosidase [Eubacteriaceae bacterium]|nr:5'-methylthioadenosine/S-adenosylhomocysteine nucleosidase [Eubacteriaceae bacterium]
MIAVIASMESEFQFLDKAEHIEDVKQGVFTFRRYVLSGTDIVTGICGTGKVAAAICAQKIIDAFRPSMVISIGTSGSMDDSVKVNTVVVAEDIVQHDFDASAFGYRKGEQCELGVVEMKCSERFLDAARRKYSSYGNVVFGRVLSGDRVIVSSDEKKLLNGQFGPAACCEMECAAIAECCLINGTEFAAVKGISDGDSSEDEREDEFRNNIVSASASLGEILTGILTSGEVC